MPDAMQIRQAGGPEVLDWTPVDLGEPWSDQVRLRQAAAGLNYIDVYHRTGSPILTIQPSIRRSLP
jgi:NADPH:quinone reductase